MPSYLHGHDCVQVGARPVEQADDGGVDVPHLVGSDRSKANLRLGRVHAEPRSSRM